MVTYSKGLVNAQYSAGQLRGKFSPISSQTAKEWLDKSKMIVLSILQKNPAVFRFVPEHFTERLIITGAQDVFHAPNDIHFGKFCPGDPKDVAFI